MERDAALDFFTGLCEFMPEHPAHISWWTHEKLERFIRNAGFTDVYRSGYQRSASPLMRQSRLFDHTHPQVSIYVEAVR